MPLDVNDIGFVVSSSAGTVTATNLDDAASVALWMPTTVSTGTNYTPSISPTDTGTAFYNVFTSIGSASVVMTCSSGGTGGYLILYPVGFRRIRITATGAEAASNLQAWLVTKQITV